jgi:hypothetical protein
MPLQLSLSLKSGTASMKYVHIYLNHQKVVKHIDRIQFSNLTTISNETVENRENNCLLFLKVQLEFKWDLIVKYNGIVREIKMAESIN